MKYWRDLELGEIIDGADRVYTYEGWRLFSDMDDIGVGEPVTKTHGPIQREVNKPFGASRHKISVFSVIMISIIVCAMTKSCYMLRELVAVSG